MFSASHNSNLAFDQNCRHSTKPFSGCVVLVCAITFLLNATGTVLAQAQFRQPSIPDSKTIGGQLISRPFSSQDELKPIRPALTSSAKPEFEFAPQSGVDFSNPISLGSSINADDAISNPQPSRFGNDRTESVDQFLGQQGFERLPPPMDDVADDRTPEGLEVIKQRFPNGKPQIIRHVAQDEQGNYYNEGPWAARNQSGQVVAAGTYRQGRMHGQWRRQHDADSGGLFETKPFKLFQGPFLSVAQFQDGKLDGLWTIYDQYRQKIFEIPYKDGIRHGTAHWFYPNNSKMRQATFKQGLIDGEILNWNEGEKLVKREQYVDGRRIVRNTTFYRPKIKKTEDYFLGSKLEPEAEDNWWDATPTPFLPKGSETQNGPSMAWYENSQPKKQGQYKNGEPIGRFIW